MTKIIISNNFIDDRKSTFALSKEYAELDNKKNLVKKIEMFRDNTKTYVLNLKPRSSILNMYASGVLGALDVHGRLEVNSSCNLDWKVRHSKMSDLLKHKEGWFDPRFNFAEKYRDSVDEWKFKELVMNLTNIDSELKFDYNGVESYYREDDHVVDMNTNLEKVTLKADTIYCRVFAPNIKSVTCDCKSIMELNINSTKLETIELPRVEKIYPETFNFSNFEVMDTKNILVKINPNAKISFDNHLYLRTNKDKIDIKEETTVLDILQDENINNYTIKDNLININLHDLQQIFTLYELHILQRTADLKENIVRSKIKDNKKELHSIEQERGAK